ncbi:NADH-quinone oxidoreductase subunit N [Rugosimonospora africana]|uniref:NADH-quinone oxidoreductase subunit N n=1 Tax=Rugosimonospora africana TaxID=556532 RepID=A0A8J3QMI7_9ACTN|nr:NADH-quinone oxidoreductase subunit N [Rugosimonospora africana]GIH12262.1 NADH-quinone oxidoreductase subunit N [Rugosimonospora africana]
MSIDQVALLPGYCAAGTALLAFLADLLVPGRRAVVAAATAVGTVATAVAAIAVGRGPVRRTFCSVGCSYVADHRAALIAVVFALLTLVVVALSVPSQSLGEYYFLLGCSMTGGVILGYTRDLISLTVAVETLTLPLYPLVAFRRRSVASAEGAITFFVVSVVSTAVTLLGAALLYASTGALHFTVLAGALQQGHRQPMVTTGAVLVIAGLAFKVAAVPMHAWAPAAYDGAPVPVAAYLSTASKLGGVIAILYVAVDALGPALDIVGPALAVVATLTMLVGNLGALRQTRMVRLLAWSSIAQAGYILAPLGALALSRGRTPPAMSAAVAATVGYAVFYVILEIGAFGAVVALRGDQDGGPIADYRGAARRAPWVTGVFTLSMIGLAGLPPGLAGLFAKVIVVRALLSGGAAWLAIVVAVNAVIGLAYYVRAVGSLFATGDETARIRVGWPVAAALGAVAVVAVVVGFAPQLVIDSLT